MKVVLDHVGIAVGDLGRALGFYHDSLGLELESPEEVGNQRVRAHFLPAGGAKIELLEASAPESTLARFLEKRGPGIHHLCFLVADIRLALEELKARGVRLIDDVPRPGAEGAMVAFVHPSSTDGVLVELKEVQH